jgi:Tol biopolymer transport system component
MRSKIPCLLTAFVTAAVSWSAQAQTTQLLSHTPSAVQSNHDSGGNTDASGVSNYDGWSISRDGRYVLFASAADNLVPGDTNGKWDIFLYDQQSGSLSRVSTSADGTQANGDSKAPAMTPDNRYVVFHSAASNLIMDWNTGYDSVFMKDLQTGVVTRVSTNWQNWVADGDCRFPAISSDGRFVAFVSTGFDPYLWHVYRRDMVTGDLYVVDLTASGTMANGNAGAPSMSDDGRFVAFTSSATNLGTVPHAGDTPSYLRDMATFGVTSLSNGSIGVPFVSPDGHYVSYDKTAYPDYARTLVIHDVQAASDTVIDVGLSAAISVDDHYLTYMTGTGSSTQVVLRDLQSSTSNIISIGSGGILGNQASMSTLNVQGISSDDRYVVFASAATNLVQGDANGSWDVFLLDRQTGTLKRASVSGLGSAPNASSAGASMSPDARYVAFGSAATNIVAGDTNGKADVFVLDRQSGTTVLASVGPNGVQGDNDSNNPVITPDGRYVAFNSLADNLVPGDTNGVADVFVRDMQLGVTTRVSVSSSGAQGNMQSGTAASGAPVISADGRYVAFGSAATNFVPGGDMNSSPDIFVHDLVTGQTTIMSVDSSGAQNFYGGVDPAISADGRYVAFDSQGAYVPTDGNGQRDVYLHDRLTGTTSLVSVAITGLAGNAYANNPSLSSDGRYVAFISFSVNLIPGSTNFGVNVFVRDVVAGVTTQVNVTSAGAQPGNTFIQSFNPTISPDGRFVTFNSDAHDLVPGDTNNAMDTFLHDRLTGTTERVSLGVQGNEGNSGVNPENVPMSADGRYVSFNSFSTNLVPNFTSGPSSIFLRDRGSQSSFVPVCFGDGTGAACPCANTGLPGHGCQNSGSTGGALLTGSGVASLAEDSVHLTSAGEMNTSSSIFLQGDAVISATPFGNGLRCTGGHLKRPYTLAASGGVVTAPPSGQPSFSARSAALGDTIQPGSTRIYQVYYHDPNLTFCPNGFNVSNAIVVAWGS